MPERENKKNRFFLPNVFGKKEICASFFTLLVLLKTDEFLRKRASFLKNKTKFCFILSQTLQTFPKHSFIFVCFSFKISFCLFLVFESSFTKISPKSLKKHNLLLPEPVEVSYYCYLLVPKN